MVLAGRERSCRFSLAAKDTLRTDLSISDEMVPSTKPWMALPSGCIAGSPEFRKMLWRLPPIHFGKEDGVERTLLRVACQSEPFLASPWQGDASIRFLWHIGCQSDFDELVSVASRPVDRGSCRRRCFSTSFYPVKRPFCRTGSVLMSFQPGKSRFCRTKTANHKSSNASEPPHRARRSAF